MQSHSLVRPKSPSNEINNLEAKLSKRKQFEEDYKKDLEKMKERVKEKPLLMEINYNDRSKELSKMKALAKVEKILNQQKVTQSEIFNAEEKTMIDNQKFLESKNYV